MTSTSIDDFDQNRLASVWKRPEALLGGSESRPHREDINWIAEHTLDWSASLGGDGILSRPSSTSTALPPSSPTPTPNHSFSKQSFQPNQICTYHRPSTCIHILCVVVAAWSNQMNLCTDGETIVDQYSSATLVSSSLEPNQPVACLSPKKPRGKWVP